MRRRMLAAGLERAVRDARRPSRGRSAAVPVAANEVLLASPLLLELAEVLRDRPVPRDVCRRVQAVLVDAESPLHAPSREGELRDWVNAVLTGV